MSTVTELYKRPGEFARLLADAEAAAHRGWDEDFVTDLKDRFQRFGGETFLSARQAEQLERIANQ